MTSPTTVGMQPVFAPTQVTIMLPFGMSACGRVYGALSNQSRDSAPRQAAIKRQELSARARWQQRVEALKAQEPGPQPGDAKRNAEMREIAKAISEGQFEVIRPR